MTSGDQPGEPGYVDEDERRAAEQSEMMVCPKCGDWLPLALGEYTCAGPGHHVAVRPYSVIPIVPPTPNDVDRTYRLAVQNALYTLLFILTILGALFLFGMCRKAGAL